MSGGRAENARALWTGIRPRTPESWDERRQSRERSSSVNRNKAENARASREAELKAENARAFVLCGEEPRTPVLILDQDSDIVAENTRADGRIGSGPDCSVPGRFILAARLRSGGRAKWRLSSAWRGARGVWRGARAVRARSALFTKFYMLSHL